MKILYAKDQIFSFLVQYSEGDVSEFEDQIYLCLTVLTSIFLTVLFNGPSLLEILQEFDRMGVSFWVEVNFRRKFLCL